MSNKIIVNINKGIRTSKSRKLHSLQQAHIALLVTFEPRNFEEASKNEHWVVAMNEELDQIERNYIQELVPWPKDKNVIGTKWVIRRKMNEDGQVTKNKAR